MCGGLWLWEGLMEELHVSWLSFVGGPLPTIHFITALHNDKVEEQGALAYCRAQICLVDAPSNRLHTW